MDIPDFLRPENVKADPKADEMIEAICRYRQEFGDDLITEPSSYSTQEWIDMLTECIEKHITIWELWGEDYDPHLEY